MQATARETRFDKLYRSYQRPVLAYLFRRADQDTALEVAADTFVVAWRRIEDIPEGDDARLWLYGVARRSLANHRRAGTRFTALTRKLAGVRDDSDPSPEAVVLRRAEDKEMLDAVAHLRPQDQELLRLATWEELPRTDIARMLGTTPHAVRQRLYRITRRLARDLRAPAVTQAHRTTPVKSERRTR